MGKLCAWRRGPPLIDATAEWLFLTNRLGWARLSERNEWALPERALKLSTTLAEGDVAVIYLTGAGRHTSALAGVIEIRGAVHRSPRRTLFDELYPLKVTTKIRLRVADPVPFRPLVPSLNFIKNKEGWGIYLKGHALKRLDHHDYQVLERALLRAMPSPSR